MSNYDYMNPGDQADRFYDNEPAFACDVCEDDADYATEEFGGACPECGLTNDPSVWVDFHAEGMLEDAAMEMHLFGDC